MRDLFADAIGCLFALVGVGRAVPVWVWLTAALLLGAVIGINL